MARRIRILLDLNILLDFMSIRKIPIKERPYLTKTLEPAKTGESDPVEDGFANELISKIRAKVLKDRDLHDKVRF